MGTVFRHNGVRVMVRTNDHDPAHVHAVKGKGKDAAEARFGLNCPEGPIELWDQEGYQRAELESVGQAIADRVEDCCAMWSDIHG